MVLAMIMFIVGHWFRYSLLYSVLGFFITTLLEPYSESKSPTRWGLHGISHLPCGRGAGSRNRQPRGQPPSKVSWLFQESTCQSQPWGGGCGPSGRQRCQEHSWVKPDPAEEQDWAGPLGCGTRPSQGCTWVGHEERGAWTWFLAAAATAEAALRALGGALLGGPGGGGEDHQPHWLTCCRLS